MDSLKSFVYYLSGEAVSEHSSDGFRCFSAKFTEACDIKDCFIIASSLNSAMGILYTELAPIWSIEYLDSHLLSISFYTNISYMCHVDDSILK